MTVDEVFALVSAPRRIATMLIAVFAGFALLLAVAGIYSVVSYGVNQRTQEIGLRVTLGASSQSLRRLIVGQALVPVAVGAGVGLAGAVALGRVMSGLLFDVGAADPLTLGPDRQPRQSDHGPARQPEAERGLLDPADGAERAADQEGIGPARAG